MRTHNQIRKIMNTLVDKQVRINLYPFKGTPAMLEVFEMAAREQGWSDTDVALAINQTRDLAWDQKYDILLRYTLSYGENSHFIQEDVRYMLHHLRCPHHYLCDKPINQWDEYDYNNYQSLKRKATTYVKSVFALFPSTMAECDKYEMKYHPRPYYDTHEEAIASVSVGTESEINIYSLWMTEHT